MTVQDILNIVISEQVLPENLLLLHSLKTVLLQKVFDSPHIENYKKIDIICDNNLLPIAPFVEIPECLEDEKPYVIVDREKYATYTYRELLDDLDDDIDIDLYSDIVDETLMFMKQRGFSGCKWYW